MHEKYSVFTIECCCVRGSMINQVFRPVLHIETLVRMWTFSVRVWRIVPGADPGYIWWLNSYINQVWETHPILSKLCLFGLLNDRYWPSFWLPRWSQVDYFVVVTTHLHRLGKCDLIWGAADPFLSWTATLYERVELCHLCIIQVLRFLVYLGWRWALRAINTKNTRPMTVSYQLVSANLVTPRLLLLFELLNPLQPGFILFPWLLMVSIT